MLTKKEKRKVKFMIKLVISYYFLNFLFTKDEKDIKELYKECRRYIRGNNN